MTWWKKNVLLAGSERHFVDRQLWKQGFCKKLRVVESKHSFIFSWNLVGSDPPFHWLVFDHMIIKFNCIPATYGHKGICTRENVKHFAFKKCSINFIVRFITRRRWELSLCLMSPEHLPLKQCRNGRMTWIVKLCFPMDLQFLLFF